MSKMIEQMGNFSHELKTTENNQRESGLKKYLKLYYSRLSKIGPQRKVIKIKGKTTETEHIDPSD